MAVMVLMTEEDLDALRAAAATLEHPGLAARLGNIAGKPIELVGRVLPEAASKAVAAATTKALEAALAVALRTMEKEPIPSLRHSSAMLSSPRRPSSTMRIFSSAERCRRLALRISRTVFSALSGMRLLDCLIVAPQRDYDEPAILSYAISSLCPTSADGLHLCARRR